MYDFKKDDRVLQIGITGGIGSGKSTVARVFTLLGIPHYDADSRARWVVENSPEVLAQIQEHFGVEMVQHGRLNRAALGQAVFPHPEKLEQLNAITHPAVFDDYHRWREAHRSAPYLLKEAALLFESGSYQSLHAVIHVAAPEELRLKRVLGRDSHRTEADIRAIMARQWPEAQKAEAAQYIISNEESRSVLAQVVALDHIFRQLAKPYTKL